MLTLILLLTASASQANWVLNGDAALSGDSITVTPAGTNRAGSAWLDTPIDLNNGFDITLVVNLGTRDSDGADGLSIVLQNDSAGLSAVGDTAAGGEWVGMHGIYPALSLEIDTWQNAPRGDPVCDHIGINEFLNAGSLPDHGGAAPVCALNSGANIEDGNDYLVRLLWDSGTTTLRVYFNGIERLVYTNDIVSDIFSGTSAVWFGVAGSTGGAYNLQQFKAIITGSELGVSKTVTPSAVDPGGAVTYTVLLENNSPITAFLTRIEDLLPAGFSYAIGTTSGLTGSDPSVSGTTLTWNGNWLLAPGQSASLMFQAQSSATPGIYSNTVNASGTNFTAVSSGPTAPVTVGSNLATSTKTVSDLNGGDAEPGDTLRYTITLTETAGRAAAAVSVTDDMPVNVENVTVVSLPGGAVNNSTGPGTGANGTGLLQIDNISVPAAGSVAVVFEVDIIAAAPIGSAIDNTAVITNPLGIGASAAAPTVIVAQSSVPGSGPKPLYLYNNPDYNLSRTPPAGGQNWVQINGGQSRTWTLTPPISSALTISADAGVIPVYLWVWGGNNRRVTLTLSSSEGLIGTVGPVATPSASWNFLTFNIPVSADVTLPAGATLYLTVANVSGNSNRRVYIHPLLNGQNARVALEAKTVINVDLIAFYDAAYPGGTSMTSATPGQNVFIRATVSDPFGSFDIAGATLLLTSPLGGVVVNNAAMTEVFDSGAAVKIFEYTYALPAANADGIWTALITADEGTEGLVQDTGVGAIQVFSPPNLMLLKSVTTVSDPANGAVNPKAIPGAIVRYTIMVTNQGAGPADGDSIIITDAIPSNTALFVGNMGQPAGPVAFIDGSAPNAPSGLTYTFLGLGDNSDDLEFFDGSNNPIVPDTSSGDYDSNVRSIRINPKGVFNGMGGPSAPALTIQFLVRIQ